MQWIRVSATEATTLPEMTGDEFFGWWEEQDDRSLDVDKAWHAIHAVLTGTAWDVDTPISTVVLGGHEFGDDTGYGRPRLLTSDGVAAAADALSDLTVEAFRERIDFARLEQLDIYPSIWDRTEEDAELLDYVTSGFEAVRTVFIEAVAAGDAIVIVCT